jgi:hypothetical protein
MEDFTTDERQLVELRLAVENQLRARVLAHTTVRCALYTEESPGLTQGQSEKQHPGVKGHLKP